MPIKLPKGFQRRKSSGNALDEVRNPAESSFKVFERPGRASKSLEHVIMKSAIVNASQPQPRNSYEQDEEDLFSVARPDASNRGSGGTENSLSTVPYDSAASSARLSTSTNPSSIDARSDRNVQVPGHRPFNDIPVPPPPSARAGFLRNSARTFSLGVGIKTGKDQKPLPEEPKTPANHRTSLGNGRDRALTASSASTATPPRLFDSDLALENTELDGFENMFDHIGLRGSRDPSPGAPNQSHFASSPPISYPPSSFPGADSQHPNRTAAVRPVIANRAVPIDSPYSWTSHNSQDGLMRSPSPSKTITQESPILPTQSLEVPQSPATKARLFGRKPLSQNSMHGQVTQQPTNSDGLGLGLRPITSQPDRTHNLSPVSDQEDSGLDTSLLASAELATRYQEARTAPSKPPTANKVMTPAQFERYKQQQEMDRRRYGASGDSDSDDDKDNYDDDEDLERERHAAKQRRKQEAHLAVYRQTMMKVTGEQANIRATSSLSPPLGTGSTSDLNRLSRFTIDTKLSNKSSGEDEDEDEDVPLGILAAHGFPNKNRPPVRLSNSLSNSNLRGATQQQQPTQSVAGESAKRGSLPVFARNLPQDPYGLVNPSNRESLGMQIAGSAPATPSGASTAHPLHPSGLVGVIAGEERARAMRRGSPNAQGNYEMPGVPQHPGLVRSQTAGNLPQVAYPGMMAGMPGMPPILTPGDQAQIQMSQQMTEMMRMQMQWMQQMQQMMGNGQGMPPQMMQNGMPPNFLAPPGPMSRPQSMAVNSGPVHGQRTMSTLAPSMANWNAAPNGNYAHSIAPSERSNVGLASRYRPVSTFMESEFKPNKRSSTFTSGTFRPWSHPGESAPQPPAHASKPSIGHIGRRSPLVPDDEDDEQGWVEMKAKKEKKQRTWKLRKGQDALQELYNGAP